jgi:hypothetical protein
VLKQLNEEQILIFNNIMYRKCMYRNIPIHIFLTRSDGIAKFLNLKLIIQALLLIYNKNLSSNLSKIKALLMASTCKVAFHIDVK